MRTKVLTTNQMKHVVRLLTKYSQKHGKSETVQNMVNAVIGEVSADVEVAETVVPTPAVAE